MTMPTSETDMYHAIRAIANARGWRYTRHEQDISRGVPDISLVTPSGTLWVECKLGTNGVRAAQSKWLTEAGNNQPGSAGVLRYLHGEWLWEAYPRLLNMSTSSYSLTVVLDEAVTMIGGDDA